MSDPTLPPIPPAETLLPKAGGGSMQLRMPGGSWFNPQRDLVYCYRIILVKAMEFFRNWPGEPGCSREQVIALGEDLRPLFTSMHRDSLKPEEMLAALQKVEAANPVGFARLARGAFYVLLGMVSAWIPDIKPRSPDDRPLDENYLKEIAEIFSRGSQQFGVPGNAPPAA